MPPPLVPELPLIVLFSTVAHRTVDDYRPRLVPAELPLMVLFSITRPPETEIPPPLRGVELPLMVLLATLKKV